MNYIKKYIVKNFYSISNEITVDLSASRYTAQQHPYRVFCGAADIAGYSKLKVFYGSNASGKTSLLRALVHAAYLASNMSDKAVPAFKNIYTLEAESFVDIDFCFQGMEFNYRIAFAASGMALTGIANETLTRLDAGATLLIDRQQQVFKNLQGETIKGLLFDKVPAFRSLLVESLTRDESYEGLVGFFRNLGYLSNIDGPVSVRLDHQGVHSLMLANAFCSEKNAIDRLDNKMSLEDKKAFQAFVLPFLQGLGIDIVGADAHIRLDEDSKSVEYDFSFRHSIDPDKRLDYTLESSGTKMLITIIYDIYYAWKTGSVLVIDELDSILHPMLVPAINILAAKNNVQLLYTTHNLHNLKYLYNDEIFLIEKDRQHTTRIRDAKARQGYENFAVLYEENQLGGLPELGSLDFDMARP